MLRVSYFKFPRDGVTQDRQKPALPPHLHHPSTPCNHPPLFPFAFPFPFNQNLPKPAPSIGSHSTTSQNSQLVAWVTFSRLVHIIPYGTHNTPIYIQTEVHGPRIYSIDLRTAQRGEPPLSRSDHPFSLSCTWHMQRDTYIGTVRTYVHSCVRSCSSLGNPITGMPSSSSSSFVPASRALFSSLANQRFAHRACHIPCVGCTLNAPQRNALPPSKLEKALAR